MDTKELIKRVREDKIKFISYQFTDINGVVKSLDGPVDRLEESIDNGIWFDGSSIEGFARIQESDMHLQVDPETYAILPWSPDELKRARVLCDVLRPNGEAFEGDPRGRLKYNLKKLKDERGWTLNIGPEPEFFLFLRNGTESIHPVPYDIGSYFDFSANDQAVIVRTELMSVLKQMGLNVEVGHHEDALGQHEIDFRFDDALKTADNVLTFKSAIKAIAAKHGLIASFMPKPIFGTNGSGMHCHQSISKNGDNLFYDGDDPNHLSTIAYGYMAGQLAHARALSAVVAPSVNSYKRLVPHYEAPVKLAYSAKNRSASIRIPHVASSKGRRIETRFPDPIANPYLCFSALMMAGLDGIQNKIHPGDPADKNLYDLPPEEDALIPTVCASLEEALENLDKDREFLTRGGVFSNDFIDAYIKLKMQEVTRLRMSTHPVELELYYSV